MAEATKEGDYSKIDQLRKKFEAQNPTYGEEREMLYATYWRAKYEECAQKLQVLQSSSGPASAHAMPPANKQAVKQDE